MSQPTEDAGSSRPAVRFVLDWIEITDSMDLDSVGEFRFLCRVRSDLRGVLHDTPLPEEGTVSISEKASKNHLGPLDLVLYQGQVEEGESITLEITGEEVDLFSPNDPLEYYERVFTGDPSGWYGMYTPWDEGQNDLELRAQWRLGYHVEGATKA